MSSPRTVAALVGGLAGFTGAASVAACAVVFARKYVRMLINQIRADIERLARADQQLARQDRQLARAIRKVGR